MHPLAAVVLSSSKGVADFDGFTPAHARRVLLSSFTMAFVTGLFGALFRKMRLRDALIAAGVSGCAGLVVGCVGVYAWPDKPYLTWAACGLAGWAGGNVVLDRLTLVAWTILKGYAPLEVAPLFEAAEKAVKIEHAVPAPHPAAAKGSGWVDLDLPPLSGR